MRILPVLLALLPFLFSASPASGAEKYAFLVGISDYDEKQLKPLPFARNDIIQFRRLLLETGFKADNIVMLVDDPAAAPEGARAGRFLPECQKIQAELEVLLPSLEEDDELVLAFCGHGVQFVGENVPYFCPLDAVLTERNTLISMTWLYEQLSWNETTQQGCRARSRLLIMDACRKDPESRLLRNSNQLELKNLQLAAPPQGVVALFSCAEGQSALEHSKLEHGVFFYHLLQGLRGQADGNRDNQVTLDEIVAFSKSETQSYARRVLQAPQTPRQLGFFDGTWVLRELQPQMLFAESIGIQLAVIPAGSFLMGSPENEEGRSGDESPQHRVQISREFRLGRTEVTKGQFAAFVRDTGYRTEAEKDGKGGYGFDPETGTFEQDPEYTWQNPGFPQTDDHPVVNVSWNDAQEFLKWLSQKDGRRYRLPTEAEWEYACRAGSTTRYWNGDDAEGLAKIANVADGTAKAKFDSWTTITARDGFVVTAPVGRFPANKFGLHDMHGNVWEWCADWYDDEYYASSPGTDPQGPSSGSSRVLRGGSWVYAPNGVRCAYRSNGSPDSRSYGSGFRVLLE